MAGLALRGRVRSAPFFFASDVRAVLGFVMWGEIVRPNPCHNLVAKRTVFVSIWPGDTPESRKPVRLTLAQDEISVESQGLQVYFTATLTLDDNGECRFLVDGTMLDRWQVLRRGLEPLFFASAR